SAERQSRRGNRANSVRGPGDREFQKMISRRLCAANSFPLATYYGLPGGTRDTFRKLWYRLSYGLVLLSEMNAKGPGASHDHRHLPRFACFLTIAQPFGRGGAAQN